MNEAKLRELARCNVEARHAAEREQEIETELQRLRNREMLQTVAAKVHERDCHERQEWEQENS